MLRWIRSSSVGDETPAVVLTQCRAPQEFLLGTDLLPKLGIQVCMEEAKLPSSMVAAPSTGDERPMVKLLQAVKIPARFSQVVAAVVEKPTSGSKPILVEPGVCKTWTMDWTGLDWTGPHVI